jgi:hypothetical protein
VPNATAESDDRDCRRDPSNLLRRHCPVRHRRRHRHGARRDRRGGSGRDGITNDFADANNHRPNVTCNPYAPAGQQSITNWFNKDRVVVPTDPSQPFGNAARNSVRGPNYWNFDFALSKYFPISSQSRVQLRLEAFNPFNRANFTAPNGTRTSAAFGTITCTFDPRQVQLGVKVLWCSY